MWYKRLRGVNLGVMEYSFGELMVFPSVEEFLNTRFGF